MKEYLTKNASGSYQLVNHRFSDDDIEVPEGSIKLVSSEKNHGNIHFINGEGCLYNLAFNNSTWYSAGYHADKYIEMYSAKILWQREPKYKEFLNAKDNYSLIVSPEHAGDDKESGLIEVPECAEFASETHQDGGQLLFWKSGQLKIFNPDEPDDGWYSGASESYSEYSKIWNAVIVWQRHTQPEELPFIDDSVNHPSHYTTHPSGIECIEITRHHDFAIGNAIKYLWRAGLKDSDNEVQDLEKAVWYIQDKIKQLKGSN